MRKYLVIPTTVLILTSLLATPALGAQVTGEPDIEISASNNHFTTGERVNLQVSVANSGEIDRGGPAQYEARVKTARNAEFRIIESRLPDGIDVKTGTVLVGSIPEGGLPQPIGFTLEIGNNVKPGRYRIPVEVEYDFTRSVEYGVNINPRYRDFSSDETKYVTVVIERRPRFDIVSKSVGSIYSGETGQVKFTIKNTGPRTASDARVKLESTNPSVFFGSSQNPQTTTTQFVSDIEPGQTKTIAVEVGASQEVTAGTYPINVVVEYENTNGIQEISNKIQTGVEVSQGRQFDLTDIQANLHVGNDGVLRGKIVNQGDTAVSNAVVEFGSQKSNIYPVETEYAVGDLEPGEKKRFNFRIEVSDQAEAGSRLLSFVTQYRNFNGDVRRS
ncbi:MAG: CARDB domain-containing protein, partial [Halobacteria archaeon]|nr:CARDB domain-containing protein [Halobacteria archaeon]